MSINELIRNELIDDISEDYRRVFLKDGNDIILAPYRREEFLSKARTECKLYETEIIELAEMELDTDELCSQKVELEYFFDFAGVEMCAIVTVRFEFIESGTIGDWYTDSTPPKWEEEIIEINF